MDGSAENEFGKRVGGRLCLDFVNTVAGRVANPAAKTAGRDYADLVVGERLVSYTALLRWGAAAGAISGSEAAALAESAAAREADAASVLERTLAVREAMYRLFKAAIEGWPPEAEDVEVLNRELGIARGRERLVAEPLWHWTWGDAPGELDRVLWPVVLSAGELLAGGDLARVGQCPGARCGWLFYDSSRSRRRQWCDMADCGNAAKVRRFRQRQRGED